MEESAEEDHECLACVRICWTSFTYDTVAHTWEQAHLYEQQFKSSAFGACLDFRKVAEKIKRQKSGWEGAGLVVSLLLCFLSLLKTTLTPS